MHRSQLVTILLLCIVAAVYTKQITIKVGPDRNYFFLPNEVNAVVGDEIVWDFDVAGGIPHSVSEGNPTTCAKFPGGVDSGVRASGTFSWIVALPSPPPPVAPYVMEYICTLHCFMTGKINIYPEGTVLTEAPTTTAPLTTTPLPTTTPPASTTDTAATTITTTAAPTTTTQAPTTPTASITAPLTSQTQLSSTAPATSAPASTTPTASQQTTTTAPTTSPAQNVKSTEPTDTIIEESGAVNTRGWSWCLVTTAAFALSLFVL